MRSQAVSDVLSIVSVAIWLPERSYKFLEPTLDGEVLALHANVKRASIVPSAKAI